MEKIGYVFEKKKDSIIVHFAYANHKNSMALTDYLDVTNPNEYQDGEILVYNSSDGKIDCKYRSSVQGKDLPFTDIRTFESQIAVMLRWEYFKFLKYIELKNKIKNSIMKMGCSLDILDDGKILDRSTRDFVIRCGAVNSLISQLRKLNILDEVLNIAQFIQKDKNEDYSGTKKHDELNLIDVSPYKFIECEPTLMEKIKRIIKN